MTRDDLVLRPADRGDREKLSSFECSTGAPCEDEVEQYIRSRALVRAEARSDYTLLVAEEQDRLVACMAYAPEVFVPVGERNVIVAVRLQVLAISLPDQGRVLTRGRRLSDALMQTMITQATQRSVEGVLTTIVAQDNARSLNLCERNGFTTYFRHGPGYVRLVNRFGNGKLNLE